MAQMLKSAQKAMLAETYYKDEKMGVNQIAIQIIYLKLRFINILDIGKLRLVPIKKS